MLTFSAYLESRDPMLYEAVVNEAGFLKNVLLPAAMTAGSLAAQHPVATTVGTVGAMAAAKLGGDFYNYMNPNPLKLLKPEEVITAKNVIPYKLIMANRDDVEKFKSDYEKMGSNPSSGLAMRKPEMMKTKTMLVVKDEAINRLAPGMGAFASGNYLVIPQSMFKELPTPTSDGVLTDAGIDAVSHEAAHTTQDQSLSKTSGLGDFDTYMNVPAEMGVRLPLLKNMMSEKTLRSMMSGSAEEIDALISALPASEQMMAKNVLDYGSWVDNAAASSGLSKEKLEAIVRNMRVEMGSKKSDLGELFRYFDGLEGKQREDYLNKLMADYNNVVRAIRKIDTLG